MRFALAYKSSRCECPYLYYFQQFSTVVNSAWCPYLSSRRLGTILLGPLQLDLDEGELAPCCLDA